jgi:hypothetical protein
MQQKINGYRIIETHEAVNVSVADSCYPSEDELPNMVSVSEKGNFDKSFGHMSQSRHKWWLSGRWRN